MSLLNMRLPELHKRLADREISAQDLVQASFNRIHEVDDKVKAFLTLNEENAFEQARRLDQAGEHASILEATAPLTGVRPSKARPAGLLTALPVGLKDNLCTEGIRTTCGSRLLANYDPIYNATVVDKLKEAGSITVGKLNMDEFAMGSSNENSGFHPTYNPWNLEYVPGGSSGGSAAAVAAGEVYYALGSDTGGSIRQPAAYCGIVGLKPTYGLVSRFGLVAFASSLDQIGPLTKNVEDAAYVLQAIAGYDPHDSTSAKVDIPDYSTALTGDIRGIRIAVPKEYMGEGLDPGVKSRITEALQVLERLGATVEEVTLPHSEYAVAAYYILASSEASSNLARYDGVRYGVRSTQARNLIEVYKKSRSEGFGEEVKRRIMLGTYALSSGYYDAYYLKAQKVRTLIKRDFDEIFKSYDAVIGPTAPTTAFRMGEQINDPLTMYLNDIYSIPVNLAGIPAISVPCGLSSEGMPVGLQIMGRAFNETRVLQVAHAYEQATDHHQLRPQL